MADATKEGGGAMPSERVLAAFEEFTRRWNEKSAKKGASASACVAQSGSGLFDADFLRALIEAHGILLQMFSTQLIFIVEHADAGKLKELHTEPFPLYEEYTRAFEKHGVD